MKESKLLAYKNKGQHLSPTPQTVFESRKYRGKTEILVHLQHTSPLDATWEDFEDCYLWFSKFFLGEKEIF